MKPTLSFLSKNSVLVLNQLISFFLRRKILPFGLICVFLFLSNTGVFGQSNEQKPRQSIIIGSRLVEYDLKNNTIFEYYLNLPDKVKLDFFPGMFFRYSRDAKTLRFGINYTQNYSQSEENTCADCYYSEANNYNLEVQGGVQYNFKLKLWEPYTFAEMQYRYHKMIGNASGGFFGESFIFDGNQHGTGLTVGWGVEYPLLDKLFVGLENQLTYEFLWSSIYEDHPILPDKVNNFNDWLLRPSLRLTLSYRFDFPLKNK
jgi:hypothetical protein